MDFYFKGIPSNIQSQNLFVDFDRVERMAFRVVGRRLLRSKLLPMFTPASTLHSHATSFGNSTFLYYLLFLMNLRIIFIMK